MDVRLLERDSIPCEQRVVIELKTIRKNRAPDTVLAEGLLQTARYADESNDDAACLVICDECPG
jgi:hypothetical protein